MSHSRPIPLLGRPATIIGLGTYVPDKVVTNDDLAAGLDTSDEWIRQRTGIAERRIAEPGVCSSDLGVLAAREALAELAPCLSPEEAPRLEADARDAALLDPLLSALGRAVTLDPGRRCWGGVRATSADGRVAVDNTLESRLERAMPSLRLHLATVFDAPAETMEVGRPTLRLDASAWPTLAGAAR